MLALGVGEVGEVVVAQHLAAEARARIVVTSLSPSSPSCPGVDGSSEASFGGGGLRSSVILVPPLRRSANHSSKAWS